MSLAATVDAFFARHAPLAAGERLLVAFSGGADSTALLATAAALGRSRGWEAVAAHLDHGGDPGSTERALRAGALAAALAVPFVTERRAVPDLRRPGESPEEAARRVRYAFLEDVRRHTGARWIATAHHLDDQAETVLLRLLQGSGLEGLAGVRPRHGRVVRPLLGVRRRELSVVVAAAGLLPIEDPTNRDLGLARNRVRHALLPRLEAAASPGGEEVAPRLARLAAAALGARAAIDRLLAAAVDITDSSLDLARLAALPEPLPAFALALLHRRAGAAHPPSAAARAELLAQIASGAQVGCDASPRWRWETRDGRLVLLPRPATPRAAHVALSYRLTVPGDHPLPELGCVLRIRRAPLAAWMFRGEPRRAGFTAPLADGDEVVVRTRRPGDRLRPLGAPGSRKLKDVLIDHRVPAGERDRLPLLEIGGQIAWVPGVTVDEAFRLPAPDGPEDPDGGPDVWTAEIVT